MADVNKVIKGLENCITGFDCPSECPYLMSCNDLAKPMFVELAKDALAILKVQEPVTPKSKARHGENAQYQHFCGNCMAMLFGKPKFCPNCGRVVMWK